MPVTKKKPAKDKDQVMAGTYLDRPEHTAFAAMCEKADIPIARMLRKLIREAMAKAK